ncbi:deoxyribodipyrimidine photolyase, partial [candidate division KSB1 bacterium]|nr:deoxyribodipyrimidine photolyase [candidate division KSB1 bacterium]NIR70654.1 deoxyribodipyrimidine photolyase [candidate division KSB1 bacterium]NIS23142.1 deoxyribodipyrimidine photolyase [candidate division KSB1 bacterium]NIT70003.1 deoxyribodipyrimidine photolyase [candidate division KSB1 bacterium]NIU23640.1 deoxyribodipyrimidine photolyase [candidate division KSB1 bacterium]
MSRFLQELSKRNSDPSDRNWLYVPYDQLNDGMGPLARDEPNTWGIILIENSWKASCRPYHKQKLTFILANMRHFALEQASRGVAVKYVFTHGLYRDALEPLLEEFGQIRVMQPAEYALRADLQPLVDTGKVQIIPHEGWLTSEEQFYVSHKTPGPPWRMDAFYRHVRQQTGLLMEHGQPVGGKYSFDAENRKSWRGQPVAPEVPTFPIDAIKGEVGKLIENQFGRHPGKLDLKKLPATKADADTLWNWAKENCMPNFGPYEDAMSMQSTTLFHTRISSLLNIHRLLPAKVVSEAAEMDVLLSSKEGFIRQVLGWREFMHHVHTVTRGFRTLADGSINKATTPGDGGYSRWAGKNWENESDREFPDGGVKPCELGGDLALPSAFWGKRSGLACLDRVVKDVWEEGYS